MGRYNLLYEPWIEVVNNQRLQTKTSIMDIMQTPENYQRLSGETAPQDFAILRLLLSILETVFHRYKIDGSKQSNSIKDLHTTWKQLWDSGTFPEVVQHYLKSQEDKFYLYDDSYPFMQVTKADFANYGIQPIRKDSGKFINRLLSESDNKVDLFSPTSDTNKNHLNDDELARWLIAFQGYTGTSERRAKYPGMTESASKGWLLSIGGIYFQGDNLFQTLMLNLILDDTKEQHPIWEKSIDDKMNINLIVRPTGLADLYTNQSRLIYIDPNLKPTVDTVSINIVQVPNIEPEFQVMEPMTLWEHKGKDKSKEDKPKKHESNQALWRSFSSLTIADDKSNDEKSRDAGLISWYYEVIQEWVDTERVKICAVDMKIINEQSNLIGGEFYDEINVNPRVLIDSGTNGWKATIMNAVKDTKTAIYILKKFTSNVCHIRNTNADMPEVIEQEAYFAVDEPFKRWLSEINMDTDKNEHSERLRRQIFNILKQKAKSIIYPLTNRDLKGIDKDNEINTSVNEYSQIVGALRNILINQGGLK